MKRISRILCLIVFAFSLSAVFADNAVKEEKTFKDGITAAVYYPAQKNKLPVVFFSHNGKQTKERWGDYPETLAEKGFLVVSIGYTDINGPADIDAAIKTVRKQYSEIGDFGKVTLIGGCHGGAMFLSMIGAGENSSVKPSELKTIVLLSLSEKRYLPEPHCPVLAVYAAEDRLGSGYQKGNKKIAEENITEPKKIIAIDGTPHGNELVADDKTKKEVRTEIDSWIERYSK